MEKRSVPLQQSTASAARSNTRIDALEWQAMKQRSLLLATLLGLFAPVAQAAFEAPAQAQTRTEFPTLDRAIQLARARALVVNFTSSEG